MKSKHTHENILALFDFDGTMTTKDSLFVFVKFLVGKRRFYKGIILNIHILLGYLLGLLSNSYAKERLAKYYFSGFTYSDFSAKCHDFLPHIYNILRQDALACIKSHIKNKHKVVIVSATFELYLEVFAKEIGADILGTKLEVKDGILTGKFDGKNCYGKQKVICINDVYNLASYSKIYVYGDSIGDREMLFLATKNLAFYRIFEK